VTAILLDSHVLYWWSSDPDRLSRAATRAIVEADELAVASISWYELAWLVQQERLSAPIPVRAWLQGLEAGVRTHRVTPAIAATAVSLPSSFPRDPADRLIYSTAIEHGLRVVTKDQRMRAHRHSRKVTIW
jgi:PIN domain nuclease of toxin-antitoxin system